jgi:hypothetical protein
MSEYLGLSSQSPPKPEQSRVKDAGEHRPLMPPLTSRLIPCPDCNHNCSPQAEHCPQCGRFFRRYDDGTLTVDRRGWATAIAGGIVLGWILVSLIAGALLVVLFILGAGLAIPRR